MGEREFERELEVFGNEVEILTQVFYAYLAVHGTAADNKAVYRLLDDANLFWNTCLYGLQSTTFIVLDRVFDQNPRSKHNIDRLLKMAQNNLHIFSKEALRRRKQVVTPDHTEWLGRYLEQVYEPTHDDFRRLRKRHVKKWRAVYEEKYRPIRHGVFAHKGVSDGSELEALWEKTNIIEMQKLFTSLRSLHWALWELFYNGEKLVLRPQRYSEKRMRTRPSPAMLHKNVQERMTLEVERFLLKCIGLQPKRVRSRPDWP
jgi:hypothetical protein